MTEFHRSTVEASVRESGKSPSQWTDNVVRVHEVLARHPEVDMAWPSIKTPPGERRFVARWADRVVDEADLGRFATILEHEFPVSKKADPG